MADVEELSLTQAAAFFGVHPDTLKKTLVPKYNIPFRKDKRKWLFRKPDLQMVHEKMYGGDKEEKT